MAQFINSRENAVTEAIEGLIRVSGGALEAVPAAAQRLNDGARTIGMSLDTGSTLAGAAHLDGHRDPGAQAVALMFDALAQQ